MPTWAVLIGGMLGFSIGTTYGLTRGWSSSSEKIRWGYRRGFTNDGSAFIEGMILGFLTLVLAHTVSPWTDFLPGWLNTLLWMAVLGGIGGWLLGFNLGHSRVRHYNVNLKPSEVPAVFGAFFGLVAYLVLTSII
jgi:hypothetical protein